VQIDTLFIRYVLVGGLNTAFGYSVFALLIFMGLHYSVAIFFATAVGILFNFVTYANLVFGKSSRRLIWRFIAIYCVLYVVNFTAVFFFLPLLHNVYAANALATVFNTVLGFYLNLRYVYEKN
jgi:putative flippase GtrA